VWVKLQHILEKFEGGLILSLGIQDTGFTQESDKVGWRPGEHILERLERIFHVTLRKLKYA
jgi:hypothetical protein